MPAGPKIKIHGIRQQIPGGFLMGRIDPGGGDPQLVSIKDVAQSISKTGTAQPFVIPVLGKLKDVSLTSPSDKQVLSYVLADTKWENVTITLGGGYVGDVVIATPTGGQVLTYVAADSKWENKSPPFSRTVPCSDETTALATGTATMTFRMTEAITLSAVRASLSTAQATGSVFTVDMKKNGTSVFSTLLTIDNTEKTSATATTPAVLSTTALADDDEMIVSITQIGDGTAKGLKIYLIGTSP